jgi:medium-chain acyl-[acyl-carrier-protein] hydrolase
MMISTAYASRRCTLPANEWWHCASRDAAAPIRLWCFPFAGGGAAMWHPWAGHLSHVAEIVPVCLPGRESRLAQAPFTRIDDLVSSLADEMSPYVNENDVFCGHSLGGLVGFELARELRARGLNGPKALVIFATRAPHLPRTRPPLHQLAPREFLAAVEQRYGAIPGEIRSNPEFLELLLPALRADLELFETYSYQSGAPLEIPVLALGGTDDRLVARREIELWQQHTLGSFEADFMRGGHFFPQDDLAETSARVRRFLTGLGLQTTPFFNDSSWRDRRP